MQAPSAQLAPAAWERRRLRRLPPAAVAAVRATLALCLAPLLLAAPAAQAVERAAIAVAQAAPPPVEQAAIAAVLAASDALDALRTAISPNPHWLALEDNLMTTVFFSMVAIWLAKRVRMPFTITIGAGLAAASPTAAELAGTAAASRSAAAAAASPSPAESARAAAASAQAARAAAADARAALEAIKAIKAAAGAQESTGDD